MVLSSFKRNSELRTLTHRSCRPTRRWTTTARCSSGTSSGPHCATARWSRDGGVPRPCHRLLRRSGLVAVPIPRAQGVPHHRHRHPDDPGRGADHLAVPGARRPRPHQPDHRPVPDLPDLRAAVHDLDAARLRGRRAARAGGRRPGRRGQPPRRLHAGHPAARSRPGSSRRGSSPSSSPGTSSSSPSSS